MMPVSRARSCRCPGDAVSIVRTHSVARTLEALGGGAAQSWVLANRSGRMIDNDYPLGFKVSLHRKDLGIALQLARETGTALPIAAVCEQLEAGLIGRGFGDDDVSAIARTTPQARDSGGQFQSTYNRPF